MPSPEATPPPPPIATTPQFSAEPVVFQCSWLGVGGGIAGVGVAGSPSRFAVRDQRQGDAPACATSATVDVGAVVGVFGGSGASVGGEEDLGAVCGHPVEEDAVGRRRGSGRRFAGVADVHVEVPVLGACRLLQTSWPITMRRAVAGDVELADVRRPSSVIVCAAGRLGDDVGFSGLQVAVIDRDRRLRCRRARTSIWSRRRSGCRRRRGGLAMKPAGLAAGWGIEPAMPWTSSPFGRWIGSPVLPSAKQGEQISGPPKAKVSRPASASSEGRGERAGRERVVGRDADVFGAPAVFAAGRDVGVDAVVGRIAGAGDAAVVDAVEDLGEGLSRFGVAAERVSGRGPGRTRRRSHRCWRPRPAHRHGNRAAARPRSAGARGRWGRDR